MSNHRSPGDRKSAQSAQARKNLLRGVSGDDGEQAARAREAVKQFRLHVLPQMNAYAKALTNDPEVQVIMRPGTPCTNGKVIYTRPPIELGDKADHERSLCGVRDDHGVYLCPACGVKEETMAPLYHEISHITEDSFAKLADSDRLELLGRVLDEYAGAEPKRVERIKANLEALKPDSYVAAASIVSPFLHPILNGLEDARVNRGMYRARPGTYPMFKAHIAKVFRDGITQDDGTILHWRDQPLEAQLTVGLFVMASELDYKGWFDEDVEAALSDPALKRLVAKMATARSVKAVYRLGFPILERFRALGFCKLPEEDDDDEPQMGMAQEGEGPTGQTGGIRLDQEQPKGKQPEAKPEESDDSEGEGDGEGEGTASEEDGDDESSTCAGEESSEEEDGDGDGEGAGDAAGPQDGAEEQEEEGDAAGPQDGAEDDSEEQEGEGSGDGVEDDDDAGSGSAAGDEDDYDGCAECGAEPGEEHESWCDFENEDHDGDGDSDDDSEDDGYGEDDDDDGDDDGSEDDSDDDGDDGESSGSGKDTVPVGGAKHGSARDVEKAMEAFGGHKKFIGHHHDKDWSARQIDAEIDRAMIQEQHFDSPSRVVWGLNVHNHEDHLVMDNGQDRTNYMAWPNEADPRRQGECGTPDEAILAPAVQRARVVFADNRKAARFENLKSGKVNARVLARRVPVEDSRVFFKKREPGKKDYFVVLGLDISGSTAGDNIEIIKNSVMAMAEMLHRLGIDFAVYCHSGYAHEMWGGGYWAASGDKSAGMDVDIFEVKGPKEPWDIKTRARLAGIHACGYNLDGHAMEFYRKVAERSTATDRIILYYNDGNCPYENYDEELSILQREIKTCKQKQITLMGVGINSDDISQHGLDTVRLDEVADVPKVVSELHKRITRR